MDACERIAVISTSRSSHLLRQLTTVSDVIERDKAGDESGRGWCEGNAEVFENEGVWTELVEEYVGFGIGQ